EGLYQFPDGLQRSVGLWNVNPGHWSITGGTTGNCWRSLYYLWDSILQDDGSTLRVNLHFNRASPCADLDSYLPYEGKLVLKMKENRPHLLIRIPEWTSWDQVTCDINGTTRPLRWVEQSYIAVDNVSSQDQITVRFPIQEWTVE